MLFGRLLGLAYHGMRDPYNSDEFSHPIVKIICHGAWPVKNWFSYHQVATPQPAPSPESPQKTAPPPSSTTTTEPTTATPTTTATTTPTATHKDFPSPPQSPTPTETPVETAKRKPEPEPQKPASPAKTAPTKGSPVKTSSTKKGSPSKAPLAPVRPPGGVLGNLSPPLSPVEGVLLVCCLFKVFRHYLEC